MYIICTLYALQSPLSPKIPLSLQGTRICAPQSSYSAEDDSTALQSALAAALMQHPAGEEREIAEGGESPLLNSEVLIPQDNPQQSLARVQDLLLQGRRSEALR